MQPIRINNSDIRGASVSEAYRNLVAEDKIAFDAAQEKVAAQLSEFAAELENYNPKANRLKRFITGKTLAKHGFYIFGEVGRGKSMLMDLFFTVVPVSSKRRAHFHSFMQDVHKRIYEWRKINSGDPIPDVARDIFNEAWLLCFDEFQVSDITDAMILSRLFSEFFKAGMVVISTSNAAPDDLYKNGLQRDGFLPFIALIKKNVTVLNLNANEDYRLKKLRAFQSLYFSPLSAAAEETAENIFAKLCMSGEINEREIAVNGRKIIARETCGDTAKFSFAELCEAPLGPADYIEIARNFGTIILTGIPKLSKEKRNEAKRFVTLIDELYEHKVKLICTAETAPEQLYTEGEGAFEFKRTVSRLYEMQSETYVASGHVG